MKTLIVLVGPTGVGKTELSLSLAEFFHSPILNADSRQLFKELNIGTAKPTTKELSHAKHFFVNTLSIDNYYSAAQYEEDALKILSEIFEKQDIAILSGGSMLYVDALCKGIDYIPTVDDETRNHIKERYENEGLDSLCNELKLIDPSYYAEVDIKNPKRIIHALEIYYVSGKPYSTFRKSEKRKRPFEIIKIGLCRERAELFERINHRVDQMMADGLLEEAKEMYAHRNLNSLNTVGYKELFSYFDGTMTLETAIERIKKNTRVYAKKQMTWFKRDDEINWFNPTNIEQIRNFITRLLA